MAEKSEVFISEGKQKNGNISVSKGCLIATFIVFVLLIVLVGLLVGLLRKDCYAQKLKEVPDTFSNNTTVALSHDQPWNSSRLPNALVPSHYVVDLLTNIKPDPWNSHWFDGNSVVTFRVMEETRYIVLNSKHLTIINISVCGENNLPVVVNKHWVSYQHESLTVELNKTMEKNKVYSLKTSFYSEYDNGLYGLYSVSYTNSTNHKILLAATQMQPYYARTVFPCFDEPAFKATFDIYLWHQLPYYGLSNMPLESMEKFDDWYRSKFETTPTMSTYLLAFVISDFHHHEAFTSGTSQVQTNIYARADQINAGNTDYAKKITPKLLDFYTKYFDVAYPLSKSDQIAIPKMMFMGMENWGLVTYKEKFYLYNSTFNSEADKSDTATLIAHEVAHQWFENLVSPVWWNELWLNEGFATLLNYFGVDQVEPSWRITDQFIIRDFHKAMNFDGRVYSHPIVAPDISTNAEVIGLFGDISYSKGACILRMIKHFLGEDAFRLGLKNYLTENAYGSVDHNELFKHWQYAVDVTPTAANPPGGFANAMKTWILQMGYPVVYIKRHGKYSNKMVVRQKRFLLNPLADPTLPESTFKYSWTVPFWYLKENDMTTSLKWLEADKDLIVDVPEGKYIIGNYETFGYYRVNYDPDNWRQIIVQLRNNFEKINVKSRGQIIDDAFNLARAKHLDYDTVLNLTQFLGEDHDLIPWQSALDQLKYLTKMLARSKVFDVYSEYLLHLVNPVYQELAWTEQTDHTTILQQSKVIDVACTFNSSHCIRNVKTQFEQWVSNPQTNDISPNFRQAVYCHAIANGDIKEWKFIWRKYLNEREAREKDALQNALTCTRSSLLIKRLLGYFKKGTFISLQKDSDILMHLCGNDHARDMVFDFVLKTSAFFYDQRLIQACTSSFSTEFELGKIEQFTKKFPRQQLLLITNSFSEAIQQTKMNIQWRSHNEQAIHEWLDNVMRKF